tara:strand:+ start:12697 stop:13035 length:339 start_codon:yes stop_codon:yes gene_type:complete
MRVRISYGVELEEIPEQAENIGYKSIQEMEEAITTLKKAVGFINESTDDHSQILKMLEKVRLKLTKTDLIITDLQAILQGLQNYYNGEQNVSERRSTMDPSGDTTQETKDSG